MSDQVCQALSTGLSLDEIAALIQQGGRWTFEAARAYVWAESLQCAPTGFL